MIILGTFQLAVSCACASRWPPISPRRSEYFTYWLPEYGPHSLSLSPDILFLVEEKPTAIVFSFSKVIVREHCIYGVYAASSWVITAILGAVAWVSQSWRSLSNSVSKFSTMVCSYMMRTKKTKGPQK